MYLAIQVYIYVYVFIISVLECVCSMSYRDYYAAMTEVHLQL